MNCTCTNNNLHDNTDLTVKTNGINDAIRTIKKAILQSRYKAAMLANRELLMLYFGVGEFISKNSREGSWGTNAIEVISAQLQKELPGLRGFSVTNLKNMRQFYESWQQVIPYANNHQSITKEIRQMPSDDLQKTDIHKIDGEILIRQLSTDEFETNPLLSHFISIGFSHHITIITGVKQLEERLFYIEQCARGFWSVEKLYYNIKSNLTKILPLALSCAKKKAIRLWNLHFVIPPNRWVLLPIAQQENCLLNIRAFYLTQKN